ncbi:MAG: hypothetical protein KF683_14425 [Rubrivivax sp.]|nr:hypothetical protein [Rubrivivax sp.]
MFNPAFDRCEQPDAARTERLAAALPAPLAALLRDELTAGNRVQAIESGHPAPPVGVCVILAQPVLTLAALTAETLQARGLVRRRWPGRVHPSGWTDAKGHCFLLEPAVEPVAPVATPAAAPSPTATAPAAAAPFVEEDLLLRARASAGPSEAMRAWDASRAIDYERWREGTGYDLDALARMTPIERDSVETSLLHGLRDWRDVQALAALDTPRARAALRRVLDEGSDALRMAVLRDAPHIVPADAGGSAARERALVQALATAELYGGLSQALDEVETFHPPAVLDALWRGLRERDGGTAVHFAAMLTYLHGAADEPFDWAQRPFFLTFHTEDAAERAAAIAELRRRLALPAA